MGKGIVRVGGREGVNLEVVKTICSTYYICLYVQRDGHSYTASAAFKIEPDYCRKTQSNSASPHK